MINELAAHSGSVKVRFWCDRNYKQQSKALMSEAEVNVQVSSIFAGKLRRYHGSSFWAHIADVPTLLRNILDIFLVALGFLQSIFKLVINRPDVVFLKGGFVCLPVGIAAHLLRIPIVIHDSDAHPGLTNRIIAPFARYIATGAPLRYYDYPLEKATYTGIPIKSEFHGLSATQKKEAKTFFGVNPDKPLVVVTGGGLGAQRVNNAMVKIAPTLLKTASIVHLCGKGQYDSLKNLKVTQEKDYKLIAFLSKDMERLLGAADIVVSRAGASAMAELAGVGAAVVLVPNGQLVGGHQLKNAKIFEDAKAVVVEKETTFEKKPEHLLGTIEGLLSDESKRRELSHNLKQFSKPHAARDVARLILKAHSNDI